MERSLMTMVLISLFLGVGGFASDKPAFRWEELRNPVLAYPNWSVKDYACAYKDGVFYLFFSAFYEDNGEVRSHVVEVATTDFKTYSDPIINIDGQKDGWIGMCSPDIVKIGDTYYLTFNSWGDKEGKPNQLFYMASKDLKNWGPIKPLATNLTKDVRAIDSALAFSKGKYILFWKEKQITRCCIGESLDGDFRFIGTGFPIFKNEKGDVVDWQENYQLFRHNGKWWMVCTVRDGTPFLYVMKGSGKKELDWLEWENGHIPAINREEIPGAQIGNASCILDMTKVDGYYYLLYAAQTDKETYRNRGWNRLCLSRSKDLKKWLAAGETEK